MLGNKKKKISGMVSGLNHPEIICSPFAHLVGLGECDNNVLCMLLISRGLSRTLRSISNTECILCAEDGVGFCSDHRVIPNMKFESFWLYFLVNSFMAMLNYRK